MRALPTNLIMLKKRHSKTERSLICRRPVFHRPSLRTFVYPAPVDSSKIASASAKLLGVILHEYLHFHEQVRYISAICAQRMY